MGVESVSSSCVSAAPLKCSARRWTSGGSPAGEARYLQFDAHYEKTRHGGGVSDIAVLIVIGVESDGKSYTHRLSA